MNTDPVSLKFDEMLKARQAGCYPCHRENQRLRSELLAYRLLDSVAEVSVDLRLMLGQEEQLPDVTADLYEAVRRLREARQRVAQANVQAPPKGA